jgi:hypothetical protein
MILIPHPGVGDAPTDWPGAHQRDARMMTDLTL